MPSRCRMGKAKAPVFELTYMADDPQMAALVVREIAALFMAENLKDRARQATATAELLVPRSNPAKRGGSGGIK